MEESSWITALERSIRNNALNVVGFGFLLGWFYSAFFSCSLVSVSYPDMNHGSDTYWSVAVLFAGLTAAVRLLLKRSGAPSRISSLAACACCVIGTLIIRVSFYSAEHHTLFYSFGAAVAGVGYGMLLLNWIGFVHGSDEAETEIVIPASFVLAFALYFLVFLAKDTAAAAIMALYPIVACIALIAKQRDAKGNAADAPDATEDEAFAGTVVSGKTVVLLFFVWLSFGFFRAYTAPVWPAGRSLYYCVPFSFSIVAAIVIIVLSARYARDLGISASLKWFFALMPAAYAVVFVDPADNFFKLVGFAIACTAILVVQIYVYLSVAKECMRLAIPATKVLCRFLIAQGLGAFLGVAVVKELFTAYDGAIPALWCFLSLTALIAAGMALTPPAQRRPDQAQPNHSALGSPTDKDAAASFDRFAVHYGLSPREQDVARLLLAGYSRPRIRDDLFISLNTVSAHVKNIYAKTGVHSHQEFLVTAHNYLD